MVKKQSFLVKNKYYFYKKRVTISWQNVEVLQMNVITIIKNRILHSKFLNFFNFKREDSKGLSCMLISNMINSLITHLTSGLFYTGFLVGYGINAVNIGIVTFVPFLANMMVVFAPYILEKFKRKKAVLTFCKVMYYTISILAFTIVPEVISSEWGRLVAMVVLNFISRVFSVIALSGHNAWHAGFLEGNEDKKTYFFTTSQFISALFSGVTLLVSGVITDALQSTPHQLTIIIILRYIAYIIAIVDVVVLALPKELPQKTKSKTKISDIVLVPLKHKKFMLTMIIVFCWQFSYNLYLTFFDVYLLNDVGVSYSFYNLIIALYPLFFVLFSRFWQNTIHKINTVNSYFWAMVIYLPTMFAYALVTKQNYLWLMLITRLIQHFIGVGQNVCFANLQFINMPQDNRVCYTSFYQLIFNLSAFLGLLAGTAFMNSCKEAVFSIGFLSLSAAQLLLIFSAFIVLIMVVYMFTVRDKISPEQ